MVKKIKKGSHPGNKKGGHTLSMAARREKERDCKPKFNQDLRIFQLDSSVV